MDTTMMDTKMIESIESDNNTHNYPPEFIAACERPNLRVAEDHYQLWRDGLAAGVAIGGEGE